jgi:transposase
MCDGGETGAAIAKHLGVGTDTITRVRRLYRQGGVAALRPLKPPGRPSKATPEFIAQMKQAVQTNPLGLGYGFATWSTVRLAEYLAKITGIRFSRDQLGRLLKKAGFSMQRPKHTLKGKRDEAAYDQARRRLQRLKKKR